MFNDDVQMGFFDVYDQYLLNILYDPRIRAGMTKDQVKELLPQILPDVRAWIAKVNGLKAIAALRISGLNPAIPSKSVCMDGRGSSPRMTTGYNPFSHSTIVPRD